MITEHWTSEFTVSKSKTPITFVCSAYEYGNVLRVRFKSYKQIYYFEVPLDSLNDDPIQDQMTKVFLTLVEDQSENLFLAKCIRCGKWAVDTATSSWYCPRCFSAIQQNYGELYDVTL